MASSQPQPYVYADSEDSLPSKLICAVCHDVCGTHSACPGCNQTFCEVSRSDMHTYVFTQHLQCGNLQSCHPWQLMGVAEQCTTAYVHKGPTLCAISLMQGCTHNLLSVLPLPLPTACSVLTAGLRAQVVQCAAHHWRQLHLPLLPPQAQVLRPHPRPSHTAAAGAALSSLS